MRRSHPAVIRRANESDALVVASLHAQSWRENYRGILTDAFLDGEIEAERAALWSRRLSSDQAPPCIVMLALDQGTPVGFSCLIPRLHASFGALLDNLHVASTYQARGLGKRLFAAAVEQLAPEDKSAPVHLLVFAQNQRACAVYDHLGGQALERRKEIEPDGSPVDVVRYQWERGDLLLSRLQAAALR